MTAQELEDTLNTIQDLWSKLAQDRRVLLNSKTMQHAVLSRQGLVNDLIQADYAVGYTGGKWRVREIEHR